MLRVKLRYFIPAAVLLFNIFASASQAKSQPNILWIITDDQRPDSIQAYNRATRGTDEGELGFVLSPNIDQLASEGVMFTNAYNNSPTCGPSRTSMHTGRYPFRNGKYAWEHTHQEADFVRPAVSQQLRTAGYSTAIIGKTHHGISETLNQKSHIFDLEIEFNRDLLLHGFGGWYSSGSHGLEDAVLKRRDSFEKVFYPDGRSKEFVLSKKDRALNEQEQSIKQGVEQEFDILRAYTRINTGLILGGVNPQPAGKTVDGYIVKEFENYLANSGKQYESFSGRQVNGPDENKPTFVNLGFHLPHTPVLPPKSFRDQFKDRDYTLPKFDTQELGTFTTQQLQIYNEAKSDGMTKEDQLQAVRDYYAFTAYGDALIGEAVEAFKAHSAKQGREYVIVLTVGDHGWHLGQQGIMGKFGSWQASLNGAAIVVSSDKKTYPPGKIVTDLVEYVDFAPTLMEAAQINTQEKQYDYLDGVDLAKVANGEAPERDYILGEMNLVCGYRAYLRTDDFAFSMRTRDKRTPARVPDLNEDITWALTTSPLNAEMALYDLRVDPKERKNVAYTVEYIELAEWFRRKLGNIVLGDGRVEMDWSTKNAYNVSQFASGADDKKIDIPANIIPKDGVTNPQRFNL